MSDILTPSGAGPSAEAAFLRQHWSPEFLGRYEGRWIAVLGNEVIGDSEDFGALAADTIRHRPLYAFVTFRDLQ